MIDLSKKLVSTVTIVCLSGCATMLSGGSDRVRVASNPPGATVFVDNQVRGQTPTAIDLDRKQDQGDFRIELPGFQSVRVVRGKHVNPWILGNLLLGGVFGLIVDIATGSVVRFDHDSILVGLTPSAGGSALPTPPDPADEKCQQQRRHLLAEAMKIPDHDTRVRAIRAVQTCD